jgi:hypothetical protein
MPLKSNREYFLWRFARSPLGSALDNCFLAVEGASVVGCLCSIRDALWVGDRWQECYWPVDFMVAPEHRVGTVGIELFQAAMATGNLVISVGYTQRTGAFHRAFKWQPGPSMVSRFMLLRPSRLAALTARADRSAVYRSLFLFGDLVIRPVQNIRTSFYGRFLRRLIVEPAHRFDERLDELLQQAVDWNAIQPFRSSRYLNWKFAERPSGAHWALLARESGSQSIRGYMVARLHERRGLARWVDIADFVVRPDDGIAFADLLNDVLTRSVSWGADFVRIRYSEDWQIPRGVSRPGIQHRRQVDTIAYRANSQDVAQRLRDSRWALTALVSDRVDHGSDEWNGQQSTPD